MDGCRTANRVAKISNRSHFRDARIYIYIYIVHYPSITDLRTYFVACGERCIDSLSRLKRLEVGRFFHRDLYNAANSRRLGTHRLPSGWLVDLVRRNRQLEFLRLSTVVADYDEVIQALEITGPRLLRFSYDYSLDNEGEYEGRFERYVELMHVACIYNRNVRSFLPTVPGLEHDRREDMTRTHRELFRRTADLFKRLCLFSGGLTAY